MGRKAEDGEFAEFRGKCLSGRGHFQRDECPSTSHPAIGAIQFGWDQALSVDNVEVPLNDYWPRMIIPIPKLILMPIRSRSLPRSTH